MFDAIVNFFNWIKDIGGSLIEFFVGMVKGLQTMLLAFPKIVTLSAQAIGNVPSIFAIFITLTIIVSIVYMIIGREAGDQG